MKRLETEMMIHFLYRMTMYIGDVTRDNIVSFMHGVQFGKLSEPHWTKLIKKHILQKHKIKGNALGWPYQVELFRKQEGLDWPEGFKKLMLSLIEGSDQIPFTKKIQHLQNKLDQQDG